GARHYRLRGLVLRVREIFPPAGMAAVEVCLEDLGRLRVDEAALFPELRSLRRRQALQLPARERALEHAPANLAAVVVELDLEMGGGNPRGLPGRLLHRSTGGPATPQQPRAERGQRHGIGEHSPHDEQPGTRKGRDAGTDAQLAREQLWIGEGI